MNKKEKENIVLLFENILEAVQAEGDVILRIAALKAALAVAELEYTTLLYEMNNANHGLH